MLQDLMAMGLTKEEAEEVLEINPEMEDASEVVSIYSSIGELGEHYLDNVVGTLDPHIDAVLDVRKLGAEVAESDDEYEMLSTGKIVEFSV